MFLNPGMQGMDRTYRGFAQDPNRRQIALRAGTLGMAGLALHVLNTDNPAYQRLEQ